MKPAVKPEPLDAMHPSGPATIKDSDGNVLAQGTVYNAPAKGIVTHHDAAKAEIDGFPLVTYGEIKDGVVWYQGQPVQEVITQLNEPLTYVLEDGTEVQPMMNHVANKVVHFAEMYGGMPKPEPWNDPSHKPVFTPAEYEEPLTISDADALKPTPMHTAEPAKIDGVPIVQGEITDTEPGIITYTLANGAQVKKGPYGAHYVTTPQALTPSTEINYPLEDLKTTDKPAMNSWDHPDADPLADLLKWKSKWQEMHLHPATHLKIGPAAYEALKKAALKNVVYSDGSPLDSVLGLKIVEEPGLPPDTVYVSGDGYASGGVISGSFKGYHADHAILDEISDAMIDVETISGLGKTLSIEVDLKSEAAAQLLKIMAGQAEAMKGPLSKAKNALSVLTKAHRCNEVLNSGYECILTKDHDGGHKGPKIT